MIRLSQDHSVTHINALPEELLFAIAVHLPNPTTLFVTCRALRARLALLFLLRPELVDRLEEHICRTATFLIDGRVWHRLRERVLEQHLARGDWRMPARYFACLRARQLLHDGCFHKQLHVHSAPTKWGSYTGENVCFHHPAAGHPLDSTGWVPHAIEIADGCHLLSDSVHQQVREGGLLALSRLAPPDVNWCWSVQRAMWIVAYFIRESDPDGIEHARNYILPPYALLDHIAKKRGRPCEKPLAFSGAAVDWNTLPCFLVARAIHAGDRATDPLGRVAILAVEQVFIHRPLTDAETRVAQAPGDALRAVLLEVAPRAADSPLLDWVLDLLPLWHTSEAVRLSLALLTD
jgi:hypothetical protein